MVSLDIGRYQAVSIPFFLLQLRTHPFAFCSFQRMAALLGSFLLCHQVKTFLPCHHLITSSTFKNSHQYIGQTQRIHDDILEIKQAGYQVRVLISFAVLILLYHLRLYIFIHSEDWQIEILIFTQQISMMPLVSNTRKMNLKM